MRRGAQMPSPFFIRSTAERLCCLTAPNSGAVGLTDTYGPLGNPPGAQICSTEGALEAFLRSPNERKTKALNGLKMAPTCAQAFGPTHLNPGLSAQLEAIPTEPEEAGSG